MDHPEVFYRWEWNALAYKYLRSEAALFIIIVREGGRLLGIAPLCLRERVIFGTWIRVLETIILGVADYQNVLIPSGQHRRRVVKAMLNWLCQNRSTWDVIDLCEFSSRESTTFQIAAMAAEFGDLRSKVEICSLTPFLDYRTYPTKSDKKKIKRIRTRRQVLLDKGYVLQVGMPATQAFWEEFCTLHSRRWHDTPLKNEPHASFYSALWKQLASQGLLECSLLSLDGRAVAGHFGFRDERKVYYYMPAMDPAFSRQRVGAVLGYAVVEHYATTHEIFDWLRGDENYKYWWTDEVAVNFRLRIFFRSNPRAFLLNVGPSWGEFVSALALPGYIAARMRAPLRRCRNLQRW